MNARIALSAALFIGFFNQGTGWASQAEDTIDVSADTAIVSDQNTNVDNVDGVQVDSLMPEGHGGGHGGGGGHSGGGHPGGGHPGGGHPGGGHPGGGHPGGDHHDGGHHDGGHHDGGHHDGGHHDGGHHDGGHHDGGHHDGGHHDGGHHDGGHHDGHHDGDHYHHGDHGHHYSPYPVHYGAHPWHHWAHPWARPVYGWYWERLKQVTCTSEDSFGNLYPVTETGYSGYELQIHLPELEDQSIDRCYTETDGDTGCRLVSCTPVY